MGSPPASAQSVDKALLHGRRVVLFKPAPDLVSKNVAASFAQPFGLNERQRFLAMLSTDNVFSNFHETTVL